MKERLTRCLQLLKVNQDSQIGKTAGLVNTLVVTTINSTTERGVVIHDLSNTS